jgi:hypothetical protein
MLEGSSIAATKASAVSWPRDIRRAVGRLISAEEKIGVVLEGLRGEERIADGECFGG